MWTSNSPQLAEGRTFGRTSYHHSMVPELDVPCDTCSYDPCGCKARLPRISLLSDPRVVALLANIRPTPSQPRPDIPCRRMPLLTSVTEELEARGDDGSSHVGPSRPRQTAHREIYEDKYKEERLFNQFEALWDSLVRSSPP
ncbi:hypothetical protein PIB30_045667 [Stylosanthes scabra]|uniref:Uncharacterized protein n=1 Tax=Stylosanthes scabra TaxID=79078 RepID=A0ABU6QGH8_9FABA|nr:hypothetical protein [Stylosanthes scabra]